MWPFNRDKKNQTNESYPEEVQQYYDAERRERSGIAWLLAAGTLVATVIIAVGLFFGGRWLINTIFDSNEPATTSETSSTDTESQEQEDTDEAGTAGDTDETADNGSDNVGAPNASGDTDTQEDDSDTSSQDNDTTGPTTTPNTGPTLPNTGPSGPIQ